MKDQYRKKYVSEGWKKIKDNLNSQSDVFSFDSTKKQLIQNDFYKSLFGRAKNRTLIKNNPRLYNSIYYYTKNLELYFKKQKSYKGWYNFTYRIKFIVEHNCDIDKLKCKCGEKYTWTTYCRFCPEYHSRTPTTETIKKQRLNAIEYIKKTKGQVVPRYNVNSIKLIENFGKKYNFNFKHAENGGEYHIKELGYWLDAYDIEKNVVLEIDEPHHFKNGKLKEKDVIRQKEIEIFLKCKFFRLKI